MDGVVPGRGWEASTPLALGAASLTPVCWATFVVHVRLAVEVAALRPGWQRRQSRPPSKRLAIITVHARLAAVATALLLSEAAFATYMRLVALSSVCCHQSPCCRPRCQCSPPWLCVGPFSLRPCASRQGPLPHCRWLWRLPRKYTLQLLPRPCRCRSPHQRPRHQYRCHRPCVRPLWPRVRASRQRPLPCCCWRRHSPRTHALRCSLRLCPQRGPCRRPCG